MVSVLKFRTIVKFSGKKEYANSADPDQNALEQYDQVH